MNEIQRRDFIKVGAAGLITLMLPSLSSCNGDVTVDPTLAQPVDLAQIWDPELIGKIGEQYLSLSSSEKSTRKLLKGLGINPSDEPQQIASVLSQKIKEDFNNQNTVMIDGWLISATEARQCALFHLQVKE